MTREEILAMEPGRELDVLVEKYVFGNQISWMQDEYSDPVPVAGVHGYIIDHYSTDISAAWEVVEKLQESHLYTDIRTCADFYEVWITIHREGNQTETFASPKLPEAICKAALLAVLEG
ncbi:hypothetical protein D3C73_909790 [compost metagenome]